ncbi:DUF6053 domain-containing protein [Lysobacter enzymogenes]|uniref:DUF6053 domain-containing protein n=1 Tax=Lysobacter enzymogenes TaxID=69 RepID=UPI003CCCB157
MWEGFAAIRPKGVGTEVPPTAAQALAPTTPRSRRQPKMIAGLRSCNADNRARPGALA